MAQVVTWYLSFSQPEIEQLLFTVQSDLIFDPEAHYRLPDTIDVTLPLMTAIGIGYMASLFAINGKPAFTITDDQGRNPADDHASIFQPQESANQVGGVQQVTTTWRLQYIFSLLRYANVISATVGVADPLLFNQGIDFSLKILGIDFTRAYTVTAYNLLSGQLYDLSPKVI